MGVVGPIESGGIDSLADASAQPSPHDSDALASWRRYADASVAQPSPHGSEAASSVVSTSDLDATLPDMPSGAGLDVAPYKIGRKIE